MNDPLHISFDFPTMIYTINGVKVSEELLRVLTGGFPDDRSYRFVRQDDIVKVRVFYDGESWWTRIRRQLSIWWIALNTSRAVKLGIEALRRAGKR